MAAKSFKIKNRFLVGLANWLTELRLHGEQTRERTRFVEVIA